ncbi:MAG: baseplate J/gp47 family protein [Eubacteriales bacterium]
MKTMEEIYSNLVETFSTHTGMTPAANCDLSIRLYAVASQIYALYRQGEWIERQCFPQTAEGDYLDYHSEMRGLERKAAANAVGTIRFFASENNESDIEIQAGTVAMTAGLVRFVTTQDAILKAGDIYGDVSAMAVNAGTSGNVAAGLIITMAVPPVGVSGCINPIAFSNGVEIEGDEQLRERILDTYKRLPNGANAAFYEQAALSMEEVAEAVVIPRSRGIGTVDLIVASYAGIPSDAVIAELAEYCQSTREIAVDVEVKAPELLSVDLSVSVKPEDNATFEEAKIQVETVLGEWFNGNRLGKSLLRGEMGDVIYQCDGVKNYLINTSLEEISVGLDQLPVLGTLTVGVMA